MKYFLKHILNLNKVARKVVALATDSTSGEFLFCRYVRISRTASLKHCLSQYRTYFSALKAVQEIHKDMYSKPVLDSRKRKNVHLGKRFSSNDEQSVVLMNFDVWTYPKFFQIFRDLYYFNIIARDLDSFSTAEFVDCSAGALQVVTTLLSQFRFPELKGLLTPECQEELQGNLGSWSENDASVLSFEPEHLIKSIPCDFLVFSVTDEKNKEKKFVEIRVIHYVWLEYSPRFQKKELHAALKKVSLTYPRSTKWRMGAVYNCKFIREITSGVNDQWTMNKINLKMFPGLVLRF